MHYFFLEKLSPYSQRWKLREVAFDPKTRYLYYSSSLRHRDIEEATRLAELSGDYSFEGEGGASTAAAATAAAAAATAATSKSVAWKCKMKVTGLSYMADEYSTPPTSEDFDESILLTLLVTGLERKMDGSMSRAERLKSFFWGSGSSQTSTPAMTPRHGITASMCTSGVPSTPTQSPVLELPSTKLHVEDYHVRQQALEEMEDEDENMFRDIELAPDEDEEDECATALDRSDEDGDDDDEEEEVIHTPLSSCAPSTVASVQSGSTNPATRLMPRYVSKTVTFTFRAPNYEAYRMFSLRIRQALVRHGLCAPLHRGLPPYDPRNGIALATVPLYLRHTFRRLNEVVFYSFQCGHVVYVRNLREVRGIHGYLCMTHDSVLLIQGDGKSPRWLDLEDITGVDYAINKNNSFVSILAADPYPDLLFIPIFPPYPLCSTFDPEEAVEGIVSMLRRLLMQRLRAGEEVSLVPPKDPSLCANDAEDIEEYDALCHIRDLSESHKDVFHYITHQGAGRPLLWRWDNSKRPKLFTYKTQLAAALKRGESDSEDDADDEGEGGGGTHVAVGGSGGRREVAGKGGVAASPGALRQRNSEGFIPKAYHDTYADAQNLMERSTGSFASFAATTVAQLLAPPSKDAELRAKRRLRVMRSSPSDKEAVKAGEGLTTPLPTAPKGGKSREGGAAALSGRHSGVSVTPCGSGGEKGGEVGSAGRGLGLPPRPKFPSYGLAPSTRPMRSRAGVAEGTGGGTLVPVAQVVVVAAGKGTKVPLAASVGGLGTQQGGSQVVNVSDVVSSDTTSSSSSSSSSSSDDDDAFDSEDMDDLLEAPREVSTGGTPAHIPRRHRHGSSSGRGAHVTVSDEEDEESSSGDEGASVPSSTLQPATKASWFVPAAPAT